MIKFVAPEALDQSLTRRDAARTLPEQDVVLRSLSRHGRDMGERSGGVHVVGFSFGDKLSYPVD